nr:MAG TPA_asm: hypothetical protein [Caudoviricetes sp.]
MVTISYVCSTLSAYGCNSVGIVFPSGGRG